MITPDYIQRSNRKTLTLSVMKDGNIIVKAPLNMRDDVINRFMLEKQDWIKSKLLVVNKSLAEFGDVRDYQKFLLYGNKYTLLRAKVKAVETRNNQIVIPDSVQPENMLKYLKNWYKQVAKSVLASRLKFVEERLKLKASSMRITDCVRKWGSCNSAAVISFNWRVVLLPPKIIDYVIVHELCHLLEMNHSKKFWQKVYSILPDTSERKEKIKEYGFLLDLFRNK